MSTEQELRMEDITDVFERNDKTQKNELDDLLGSDDDDDDDDEDQSNSDPKDSDGEDSYEASGELKDLIDNLPQSLRNQVLNRVKTTDSDMDDNDEEENDDSGRLWGKKKNIYWTGDTADLEIGQDVEDAEEEEAAAIELQRERLKGMTEDDFAPLMSGSDGSDQEVEVPLSKGKGPKGSKGKTSVDHSSDNIAGLVAELKERLSDLTNRLLPLASMLKSPAALAMPVSDEVVQFVETKVQLLLSYIVNLLFYLWSRASGCSVRRHPVMKQLLKLRYAMEKAKALEGRLKGQIDRLLRQLSRGTGKEVEVEAEQYLQPNPASLLAAMDDDSDNEEVQKGRGRGGEGLYRAPKMMSTPFIEGGGGGGDRKSVV